MVRLCNKSIPSKRQTGLLFTHKNASNFSFLIDVHIDGCAVLLRLLFPIIVTGQAGNTRHQTQLFLSSQVRKLVSTRDQRITETLCLNIIIFLLT